MPDEGRVDELAMTPIHDPKKKKSQLPNTNVRNIKIHNTEYMH